MSEPEAPPPVGGSWGRLYTLVLAALAVSILLLRAFARAFS